MGIASSLGCLARMGRVLNLQLPALRDELSVFEGPSSLTGAPSWSVYDPVRNLYFRIDWPTFEILCRWEIGDPQQITAAVCAETTLDIDESAIEAVITLLQQQDLIKRNQPEDGKKLYQAFQRRQQSWHSWLLHRYLFFRVPLLRPDSWLGNTLPLLRWLGSRAFALTTFVALFVGIFLVSRQWDGFSTYLIDLFSLEGLLAYAVTLIVVKFLHELGHAYCAKHYGCRVPTLGIAFLVMFPMAYTDVNDVWRLKARKARLSVGAAGILTELSIAAWATLAWSLVPDGPLRTGLFLLATTTWVSTLAINASPFLRFDGYFLLMDALDLPNLHSRAFTLTRWRLRELLFALDDPQPELYRSRMSRFLKLFALGTWIYRLIVFGGIAVLVYLMFPKPLGPFLAAVEIYWFILKPIVSELSIWQQRWRDIVKTRRTIMTSTLLTFMLGMVFIPWDPRIKLQAVLQAGQTLPIVVTDAAKIVSIEAIDGTEVQSGAALLILESAELNSQLLSAKAKVESLKVGMAVAELSDQGRSELAVLRAKLNKAHAQVSGLQQQIGKLDVRANTTGILRWSILDMHAGDWLQSKAPLGFIQQTSDPLVIGFIGQQSLGRVALGDAAVFIDEVGRINPITLRVISIDRDSTRILNQPLLASTHGGEILVRHTDEQLIPDNAIYRVVLTPQTPLETLLIPQLRGRLIIKGKPEAWSRSYYRSLVAILIRESSF